MDGDGEVHRHALGADPGPVVRRCDRRRGEDPGAQPRRGSGRGGDTAPARGRPHHDLFGSPGATTRPPSHRWGSTSIEKTSPSEPTSDPNGAPHEALHEAIGRTGHQIGRKDHRFVRVDLLDTAEPREPTCLTIDRAPFNTSSDGDPVAMRPAHHHERRGLRRRRVPVLANWPATDLGCIPGANLNQRRRREHRHNDSDKGTPSRPIRPITSPHRRQLRPPSPSIGRHAPVFAAHDGSPIRI